MTRRAVWPFAVGGVCLAAALLLLAEGYRYQNAAEKALIPVAFDHADHSTAQCVECHHNFVDDTGGGTCYNCHKYAEDIAADMEKMFHDFCFGCHVKTRMEGEASGPMRECMGCH
jgi:hypothetical protein